jgi:hypothetical protein
LKKKDRSDKLYLEDLLTAMNRIAEYIEGHKFDQFKKDYRTVPSSLCPRCAGTYLIAFRKFQLRRQFWVEVSVLLKKQVDNCRYLDSNILLNLRYDSKKATYYPIDSTEGK